ncbi:MAG: UDP-N-acetylmuramoyl-tripeptide--D-alanyl-D-alanine ligase, partial [Anaerolineales bacterium]|nr:UDP-N-acetylmuramoyl-tripeptide--D-alanyl-D-alanine ligase [Anaerolineales bacterium]
MSIGGLTLSAVVEALTGRCLDGLDQPLSATVVDSRKATPGTLFVALRGERADGHDYVMDAFSRGAVAVIVERDVAPEATVLDLTTEAWPETVSLPLVIRVPSSLAALQRVASFWRQRHPVRVVGITGSVGKTTTKELAAAVLARRYKTLKSEASYNNEVGLPLALLGLTDEHERAVLEMGMYDVGEISDLARIAQPHVGVVTVIAPVHLERAKTIERIVEAKSELLAALPAAPEGVAILNYDDERVREMAKATRARLFYYGLSPQADLWADQIESLGLQGIRLQLHYGEETLSVKIPLLGRHSVHTALGAAV